MQFANAAVNLIKLGSIFILRKTSAQNSFAKVYSHLTYLGAKSMSLHNLSQDWKVSTDHKKI